MDTPELESKIIDIDEIINGYRQQQQSILLQIIRNISEKHGVRFERLVLKINSVDSDDIIECELCESMCEPAIDCDGDLSEEIWDVLMQNNRMFQCENGFACILPDDSEMEFLDVNMLLEKDITEYEMCKKIKQPERIPTNLTYLEIEDLYNRTDTIASVYYITRVEGDRIFGVYRELTRIPRI